MQIPSVGRIVLVMLSEPANGSHEAPAIVTAVHSDTCINARVFCDGPPHERDWMTSLVYEDDPNPGFSHTWRWPPRFQAIR